jgi:hypothetical protein
VDTYGGVNVVFYDSRIDPTNNKLAQIYLARSTDGGETFQNWQISDVAFTLSHFSGTEAPIYYAGDYIGITSTSEYAFPCWNDNRLRIRNPQSGVPPESLNVHQAFIARFGIYTVPASISSNWNMVSVPDTVHDPSRNGVWPNANSYPFKYVDGSGYVQQDTATTGVGYFIKYTSAPNPQLSYIGAPVYKDTINVTANWNIIGSLSKPLGTSKVKTAPAGIVVSNYFQYTPNSGYSATNTITPGLGYWVKLSQSGKLILDTSAATSSQPGGPDQPPCAPSPPAAPSLVSPDDGVYGQSTSPTLSWSSSNCATSYEVQLALTSSFTPGSVVYDNASLGTTSQQVSGLSNSTTYYWHVNASNSNGASDWSGTRSFTTENAQAPPPPCACCQQIAPSADVFTITDARGYSQTLYARAGALSIPMPPPPPDSLMNVRFQSGNYLQSFEYGQTTSIPIIVQNAASPLTFSWKINSANNTIYSLGLPDSITIGNPGGKFWVSLSDSGTLTIGYDGQQVFSFTATGACGPQKTVGSSPGSRNEKAVSVPARYALAQNYPDPFNPMTIVKYDLPEEQHVTLKVYNLLGQEVRTLVDRVEDAGFKEALFDSGNLPSGIYFYRLRAGKFIDVKKMILLR